VRRQRGHKKAKEVPIVEWQAKPYIRVSIQAYNTPEDVDHLAQALEKSLG